jgi:hypothetical protein
MCCLYYVTRKVADSSALFSFPDCSNSSRGDPRAVGGRALTTWKCDRAHSDDRASPRKSNVCSEGEVVVRGELGRVVLERDCLVVVGRDADAVVLYLDHVKAVVLEAHLCPR